MIKATNIRKIIKECAAKNIPYKTKLRELLGVEMKQYPEGLYPCKVDFNKAQVSTEEFSLRDLAEEFLGQEWVGQLHNGKTSHDALTGLSEALNPVLPSSFNDISAFQQTVGGLVEVRILEAYNLPEFIGSNFVEVQPTRVNGGKLIGIPSTKAPQQFTLPGEEMPSVGLRERWAIAPANLKYAQKIALSRESVVYDLSGELLSTAEGVGRVLALGKEVMIGCTVMGINLTASQSEMLPPGFTGNSYRYDAQPSDSPNNTYQTTKGTGLSAKYNYINELSTNYLVDYTNLQAVQSA